MSNELLGYDEALVELKTLEKRQRYYKKNRKTKYHILIRDFNDNSYRQRKKEIKILLSLIAAHKQSRKLYGLLKDIRKDLGMSSDAYKRVSEVVND